MKKKINKSKKNKKYSFLLKGPEAFLAFSTESDLDQISDLDLFKISKLTYDELISQTNIESFTGERFLLDLHVVKALQDGLDILTRRNEAIGKYLCSCLNFQN
jgi:hypothetical protein